MRKTVQWNQHQIGFTSAPIAFMILLIVSGALLVQCFQPPTDTPEDTTISKQSITRDGYIIELFATPEQQLQYTRKWYCDPGGKRTALELLIKRFPEAKSIRAEAELDLAYLTLGEDYRFADQAACLRAVKKYQKITSQYAGLLSVCAKACWYMGWIYTDILKQKRKGLAYYQIIVKRYPDAILTLSPPVPWAGKVLPQAIEKPKPVYQYPIYKWRNIALLEIIRNSDNEDEKWTAFEELWSHERDSLAMGYAFRFLIKDSSSLAQKTAAKASEYLKTRQFSPPIAEEVRIALESLKFKAHPSPKKGRLRLP